MYSVAPAHMSIADFFRRKLAEGFDKPPGRPFIFPWFSIAACTFLCDALAPKLSATNLLLLQHVVIRELLLAVFRTLSPVSKQYTRVVVVFTLIHHPPVLIGQNMGHVPFLLANTVTCAVVAKLY
jgi:hypothetical protein